MGTGEELRARNKCDSDVTQTAARDQSVTGQVTQDALVFGTAAGKPQNPSNVRARVLTKTIERANSRLAEKGEAPLPALTPHGLRRSFASLLYGIGEPPPVVMEEMGHTDPALALSIYAHAMRRDDGENERLKALIEGVEIPGLVTSDHSLDPIGSRARATREAELQS
jgi:integrase